MQKCDKIKILTFRMVLMKNFKLQLIEIMQKQGFDREEARNEIDFFVETVSGKKKKDFLMNPLLEISTKEKEIIDDFVKKRIKENIPAQYLVGKAYFMNEEFFVDNSVLIPRPETEILVKEAEKLIIQRLIAKKSLEILDIGTGSGCIPIMLAKILPENVKITACDISEKAIETAKKNAQTHKVGHKINFFLSDIFSGINEKFDLIVSNPPYIPLSMKKNLQKEVVMHEPQNALFAEDAEGIEFYKKIIEQSQKHLNKEGIIIFELGINQSKLVEELFLQNGFEDIQITKDFDNIERVISGSKKTD
jgi:release factor glutamine methyltransferase